MSSSCIPEFFWISFFHRSRLEKILQQGISQNFVIASCEEQVKEFSIM
jgi:hypothetical protein